MLNMPDDLRVEAGAAEGATAEGTCGKSLNKQMYVRLRNKTDKYYMRLS